MVLQQHLQPHSHCCSAVSTLPQVPPTETFPLIVQALHTPRETMVALCLEITVLHRRLLADRKPAQPQFACSKLSACENAPHSCPLARQARYGSMNTSLHLPL